MERIIHFNIDRIVGLVEETTREVKSEDSKSILITTYVSSLGDKVIEFNKDTTAFEGY
jgi:hypothetical protein